jgi:YacP-like NYN domain-containing protein
MLVVDAANVVGSRPNGWWRDRAGAAQNLCRGLTEAIGADRLEAPVVVVLEGAARRGVEEGEANGVRVVHAPRSGDDTIAELAADAAANEATVTVITADRELRDRVRQVGADVLGPRWLLDLLP